MKPPVAKLLPQLQRETQDALEKIAAADLNLDLVRERIYAAARQGHNALRLRNIHLCDLRGTTAAVQLVAWCRETGLTLSWESRSVDTDDGRRVVIHEPEVTWART